MSAVKMQLKEGLPVKILLLTLLTVSAFLKTGLPSLIFVFLMPLIIGTVIFRRKDLFTTFFLGINTLFMLSLPFYIFNLPFVYYQYSCIALTAVAILFYRPSLMPIVKKEYFLIGLFVLPLILFIGDVHPDTPYYAARAINIIQNDTMTVLDPFFSKWPDSKYAFSGQFAFLAFSHSFSAVSIELVWHISSLLFLLFALIGFYELVEKFSPSHGLIFVLLLLAVNFLMYRHDDYGNSYFKPWVFAQLFFIPGILLLQEKKYLLVPIFLCLFLVHMISGFAILSVFLLYLLLTDKGKFLEKALLVFLAISFLLVLKGPLMPPSEDYYRNRMVIRNENPHSMDNVQVCEQIEISKKVDHVKQQWYFPVILATIVVVLWLLTGYLRISILLFFTILPWIFMVLIPSSAYKVLPVVYMNKYRVIILIPVVVSFILLLLIHKYQKKVSGDKLIWVAAIFLLISYIPPWLTRNDYKLFPVKYFAKNRMFSEVYSNLPTGKYLAFPQSSYLISSFTSNDVHVLPWDYFPAQSTGRELRLVEMYRYFSPLYGIDYMASIEKKYRIDYILYDIYDMPRSALAKMLVSRELVFQEKGIYLFRAGQVPQHEEIYFPEKKQFEHFDVESYTVSPIHGYTVFEFEILIKKKIQPEMKFYVHLQTDKGVRNITKFFLDSWPYYNRKRIVYPIYFDVFSWNSLDFGEFTAKITPDGSSD
ncbi:hypothetical protein KAI78_04745 [bacterium]|nr:hypothetical protein [bacterium]